MSEHYVIRKNVELPDKSTSQRAGKSKYGLEKMEIGDSFTFPSADMGKVSGSASLYGRKYNRKFTTRVLADGSVGVWRLA